LRAVFSAIAEDVFCNEADIGVQSAELNVGGISMRQRRFNPAPVVHAPENL